MELRSRAQIFLVLFAGLVLLLPACRWSDPVAELTQKIEHNPRDKESRSQLISIAQKGSESRRASAINRLGVLADEHPELQSDFIPVIMEGLTSDSGLVRQYSGNSLLYLAEHGFCDSYFLQILEYLEQSDQKYSTEYMFVTEALTECRVDPCQYSLRLGSLLSPGQYPKYDPSLDPDLDIIKYLGESTEDCRDAILPYLQKAMSAKNPKVAYAAAEIIFLHDISDKQAYSILGDKATASQREDAVYWIFSSKAPKQKKLELLQGIIHQYPNEPTSAFALELVTTLTSSDNTQTSGSDR